MSSACRVFFSFPSSSWLVCRWVEQERAKEADRGLQKLEQREAMADKAEEVTKMAVTVFHCKEVRTQDKGRTTVYIGVLVILLSPQKHI